MQTITYDPRLKISIVHKSNLGGQTRLDPEFYRPEYLVIENNLIEKGAMVFSEIADKVTDGTHFTPTYIDEGVPFLSALNVIENRMVFDKYNYISSKEHQSLIKRAYPKEGDILLRKVGVGPRYASVVPKTQFEFSIFVSLALIKVKEQYKETIYYLTTFINSSYGQKQLLRLNKGISQPDLHLEDIRDYFLVPIPKKGLDEEITQIIIKANEAISQSITLYKKAGNDLLKLLEIDDYKPDTTNYSSRNSSECILANRFDSEYWLPKYDQLINLINKHPTTTISNYFHMPVKGIEVGSEEYVADGLPFVRVSDFTVYGIDENTDKKITYDLYEKLREDYQPKKGELIFTKDGTIGVTAVLDDEMKVILSGAFLRLKQRTQADPHYLALLLNSVISKTQIERLSGGALITHFKPEELKKIVVPIVDEKIQIAIGNEVREALSLRKKSKHLLDVAKRAVEIFIEEDEEKALSYIKKNYE